MNWIQSYRFVPLWSSRDVSAKEDNTAQPIEKSLELPERLSTSQASALFHSVRRRSHLAHHSLSDSLSLRWHGTDLFCAGIIRDPGAKPSWSRHRKRRKQLPPCNCGCRPVLQVSWDRTRHHDMKRKIRGQCCECQECHANSFTDAEIQKSVVDKLSVTPVHYALIWGCKGTARAARYG